MLKETDTTSLLQTLFYKEPTGVEWINLDTCVIFKTSQLHQVTRWPKLVHDVISAPFTTVSTNLVQRDCPVMLPKSQLLYKLTDSDPTYPIKVRAPDTATKVEARKTKPVTTKTDMSTKIMNEYERRVKLGELITLNDFTRYGTLGGPEVKRCYVHRV